MDANSDRAWLFGLDPQIPGFRAYLPYCGDTSAHVWGRIRSGSNGTTGLLGGQGGDGEARCTGRGGVMGLELLLGKAGAVLAGVLGFLALLLGAFFKGKRAERQKAELEALRATHEAQKRVGEAVGKDPQIDAEAARKAQEAREKPKDGGRQGETYKL